MTTITIDEEISLKSHYANSDDFFLDTLKKYKEHIENKEDGNLWKMMQVTENDEEVDLKTVYSYIDQLVWK